jgi:hypothetical protein
LLRHGITAVACAFEFGEPVQLAARKTTMIAAAGRRMRCRFDAGFLTPAADVGLAANDGYFTWPASG